MRSREMSTNHAVLGGGNGGLALAMYLSLNGANVGLFEHPSVSEGFQMVRQTGNIHTQGMLGARTAQIPLITCDIVEVMHGADVVHVVVPGSFQDTFFKLMIPNLQPHHTVVIWASSFGSLRLRKLLQEMKPDSTVCIIETNTLPFGVRKLKEDSIFIFALASRIVYSALPSRLNSSLPFNLEPYFPELSMTNHVLSVGLNNPNPIVHPMGSLLNIGLVQSASRDFHLYKDGTTEAILRTIEAIYNEIRAIGHAYDCRILDYSTSSFFNKTSVMGANFRSDVMDMVTGQGTPRGPNNIHDRYFTEDIPFGLVPIAELGRRADIDCKIIRSLIDLGSIVCAQDFWATGRNLETLGLQHLSTNEITELVCDLTRSFDI